MGVFKQYRFVKLGCKMKRINYIDALKGFAIIFVVLGHVADGFLKAGMYMQNQAFLRNIYNVSNMFHMALFFTLSGTTYSLAYFTQCEGIVELKNKNRFKQQLCNIVLLYFLYCILNWAFKLILSSIVNTPIEVMDILFIWLKPIYPYWYLYVLFILYIGFYYLRIASKPKVLFSVLFMLSSISGFVKYINKNGWFELQHVLFFSLFFFLGIWIASGTKLIWEKGIVLVSIMVSFILSVAFFNDETYICSIPLINTIVSFGIVVCLVWLFKNISAIGNSKTLIYLGRHSLEIYLLHCFITAANRSLFVRMNVTNIWIAVITNELCGLILPLLFSYVTRRWGYYNLFFRPINLFNKTR